MTFSQDFEREADYVGIYALGLADLPISSAPRFWRRMAVANPEAIAFAHSHPTTAERFVRLEQTIHEVDKKIALKLPLRPDPAGTPKQFDTDSTAVTYAKADPTTAPAAGAVQSLPIDAGLNVPNSGLAAQGQRDSLSMDKPSLRQARLDLTPQGHPAVQALPVSPAFVDSAAILPDAVPAVETGP